jgi:nicotinamidase/pyrazinamidase
VARCNAEIVRALTAGAAVFYTQDWHPESTPHFEKDGGVWPVHCVKGTAGADFHPRLLVAGSSVKKGSNGEDGYSGFSMRDPVTGETTPTELEAHLRRRGIDRLVVVGLALDYCVKATALDGAAAGFPVELVLDATAPVNLKPEDGDLAIQELKQASIEVK